MSYAEYHCLSVIMIVILLFVSKVLHVFRLSVITLSDIISIVRMLSVLAPILKIEASFCFD